MVKKLDPDLSRQLVRFRHEDGEQPRRAVARRFGVSEPQVERTLWAWEPKVYPAIRLEPTPEDVASAREGTLLPARLIGGEHPRLRWDRIAERADISVDEARRLYEERRGSGAASQSYTGKGRRFSESLEGGPGDEIGEAPQAQRAAQVAEPRSTSNEACSTRGNLMSQLSAAAQQLFDALSLDGEKRGNIGLIRELALGANEYALARDELLELGLVELGHGRGGSVGRSNGATPNQEPAEMSSVAGLILNTLPQDGSRVGNISFRRDLGLSQSDYDDGKRELVRLGHVILGSGQGGSIRREQGVDNSADEYYSRTPLTAAQTEAPALEADPADLIEETDELIMSDDNGGDDLDAVEAPQAADRHIFSDKSDPSVHELYIRYKEGDLILQPDFQRQFVWDVNKCSRLVESAILEVPLPMIYLSEEADGREAVIDGQQRLTAFFKFLDAEYALRSLTVLSDLNGSRFVDLDRLIQNKVKRCSIRVTTIKKESSEDLRFEIFERLNTGAMALNDQELRNCIFRGPYNDLLRELSQGPEFRAAVGIKRVEKRMRDVELVLRFGDRHFSLRLGSRSEYGHWPQAPSGPSPPPSGET